jgi:hypothetical protein
MVGILIVVGGCILVGRGRGFSQRGGVTVGRLVLQGVLGLVARALDYCLWCWIRERFDGSVEAAGA